MSHRCGAGRGSRIYGGDREGGRASARRSSSSSSRVDSNICRTLGGGIGDGLRAYDLQSLEVVAMQQFSVEKTLKVVHAPRGLRHVQTHGEGVKVVVHEPNGRGREKLA